MDAKRVIDKYKAEAAVEQQNQEALRQEIAQLKAQGGGGAGGGGGGAGGNQAAKMDELEMQAALFVWGVGGCVGVCVCVCLCIYLYTYVYVYLYVYILVCVCVCVCVCAGSAA